LLNIYLACSQDSCEAAPPVGPIVIVVCVVASEDDDDDDDDDDEEEQEETDAIHSEIILQKRISPV
jgi:hypothetical protein